MPFRDLMNDRVTLIKKDGRRFENIQAAVFPTEIHSDDASLPIEEGDKLERVLPNGLVETYLVLDRGFHSGMPGAIGDHYQTKVRKESALPRKASGPTIYNITGPNARVNINSVDLSANVVDTTPEKLFRNLVEAIEKGVADERRRSQLVGRVGALEAAVGKDTFLAKYRELIASAADHMTLLSPFIPALTQLLK